MGFSHCYYFGLTTRQNNTDSVSSILKLRDQVREKQDLHLLPDPQNHESHPALLAPDHQAMGKVAKIHNNASAARELDMYSRPWSAECVEGI